MRLRGAMLLVATLSLLTRLPLAADERKGEIGEADHFQAEIKELGGFVRRDRQHRQPGGGG